MIPRNIPHTHPLLHNHLPPLHTTLDIAPLLQPLVPRCIQPLRTKPLLTSQQHQRRKRTLRLRPVIRKEPRAGAEGFGDALADDTIGAGGVGGGGAWGGGAAGDGFEDMLAEGDVVEGGWRVDEDDAGEGAALV